MKVEALMGHVTNIAGTPQGRDTRGKEQVSFEQIYHRHFAALS
jgi:hypothetical protein